MLAAGLLLALPAGGALGLTSDHPAAAANAKPKKVRKVSVRLDVSHAATAVVGTAGGTLKARTASGTTLQLSVPAGALAENTELKLTPVASLAGLPKGLRLVSGVQLAPEGLVLAKSAALTMKPRRAAGARGLAWFERGADVSRYPAKRSGSQVRLTITHFSGAGAVSGPASAYAAFPTAADALKARYRRQVRPALNQAVQSDEAAFSALDQAWGLLREAELLGLGGELKSERAEIYELAPKILENAIGKSFERCATKHDLSEVKRLLAIDRYASLLGITLSGGNGLTRVASCARFELDMELSWTADWQVTSGDGRISYLDQLQVKTERVPIELQDALVLRGEKQLDIPKWNEDFTVTTPDFSCTVHALPPSPLANLQATLEIDTTAPGKPEIYLVIDPGDVKTPRAPGCGATDPPPPPVYRQAWEVLYASAKLPDGRYRFHLTEYLGGDLWARFGPDTHSGTTLSTTWSGTLSLMLRHVPER